MVSGTYVLAAGGTGGHLFPAEAVARLLVDRECAVHLFTDRRADAFAAAVPGVMIEQIRAGRFGGGPLHAAYGLAELAVGMVQARRRLRRLAPAAVLGFGGYPSVPTMLAAAQLGLPTLIHEQNAVFGRANRLLATRAHCIATGFPATRGLRDSDGRRLVVHTGNPVRAAIRAVGADGYAPPNERIELLVTGGSQGARVFSDIVPSAVGALPETLRTRLRVSQQARPEDAEAVEAQYRRLGITAEVAAFFHDMPARLQRAHLAICRAGASTISELAAAGRPAVLVPYPHAMDDHQTINAGEFAGCGGGWVMPQPEFTAETLRARLTAVFGEPSTLAAAAAAARAFARDDAAERLAELAQGIAGSGDAAPTSGAMERAA
ncbi:MAG: undecaprenyldiphospho-muramoylpentapeptide beta-N-acetylglucosaminyltransferase [Alphaproteobacteria bacterium]|nr:undecaprenyldiphospho-muramoylpentapeptide beta-N-acetylglucosaminyltransferase [Alphaproteobacteria bacterium]